MVHTRGGEQINKKTKQPLKDPKGKEPKGKGKEPKGKGKEPKAKRRLHDEDEPEFVAISEEEQQEDTEMLEEDHPDVEERGNDEDRGHPDGRVRVSIDYQAPEDMGNDEPALVGVTLTEQEHRNKWYRLSLAFSILDTKFMNATVLRRLGLYDCVMMMLRRIGWHVVLGDVEYSTYPVLVKEFLSSLQVEYKGGKVPSCCSFQLGNEEYFFTTKDLNSLFVCPLQGAFSSHPSYNKNFYKLICDTTASPVLTNKSKASYLRNPVFRYLQKLLASTVLARHENSNLRDTELFIFWCMMNSITVDFAAHFLAQCHKQTSQSLGVICIGGLVTPLAQKLGVDLSQYEASPGPCNLDLKSLRNAKFLSSSTPPFEFVMGSQRFPLPNPAFTDLSSFEVQDNWLMDTEQHLALMREPKTPRQRAPSFQEEAGASNARPRRSREDVHEDRMGSLENAMMKMTDNFERMSVEMNRGFVSQRRSIEEGYAKMQESFNERFDDFSREVGVRVGRFSTDMRGLQTSMANVEHMLGQWTGSSSSLPPRTQHVSPYPPHYQYPPYPPYPPYPHQRDFPPPSE